MVANQKQTTIVCDKRTGMGPGREILGNALSAVAKNHRRHPLYPIAWRAGIFAADPWRYGDRETEVAAIHRKAHIMRYLMANRLGLNSSGEPARSTTVNPSPNQMKLIMPCTEAVRCSSAKCHSVVCFSL